MTSRGYNFNDFPKNQLSKFLAQLLAIELYLYLQYIYTVAVIVIIVIICWTALIVFINNSKQTTKLSVILCSIFCCLEVSSASVKSHRVLFIHKSKYTVSVL